MRTFLQTSRFALPPRLRLSPGSQAGDTLIEVLISAMLIALMVAATVTGLNSTDRDTALSRARSEADVLAQQEEARLRSEPVSKLSELLREEHVTQNGTNFTIKSTAQYRSSSTATSSCSSATNADYIETSSTVTWPELGTQRPVVETGIISPPPDTNLLVDVTDQGSAVPGAGITATGPATAPVVHKFETSTNGCAVLATTPGEYTVNVSKTGWVTPNGFASSEKDPLYEPLSNKYLVAESTTPFEVELGPASTLEVKFGSSGEEGDSFILSNPNLTGSGFKAYGELGKYHTSLKTAQNLFPFHTHYSAYAGTCTEDNPEKVSSTLKPASVPIAEGLPEVATVKQPPINIVVMSGSKKGAGTQGQVVKNAVVRLNDTNCPGSVRQFETTSEGTLSRAHEPFGTFELCVVSNGTRFVTPAFLNNTEAGPELLRKITNDHEELSTEPKTLGYGVIYLGAGAEPVPGKLESQSSCPF